ncbi:hypothetical protein FQR65_LT16040 [Abscondita terminalis]|nr:hypothetical protein FQR65_LT16040 [Abscondita terminalis]
MEGHGRYDYWLWQFAGVDQMTGQSLYLADTERFNVNGSAPGKDPIPAADLIEINGKYYVTNPSSYGKRDWSGSVIPKMNGSFNTLFTYKNFSLSGLFTYAIGGKTFDESYRTLMTIPLPKTLVNRFDLIFTFSVNAGIEKSGPTFTKLKGMNPHNNGTELVPMPGELKNIISRVKERWFLASCNKDYLDTVPTEKIGTPTVFETTANVKLAVNGLAKMMTSQYLESQGFNGEGTIKMYYGKFSGKPFLCQLRWLGCYYQCGYNGECKQVFICIIHGNYYYKIIGNANIIIHSVDAATGPESEKQFLKAQALTYRAYSFMMLAQIYGYRWSDSNNGSTSGLILRTDMSTGDKALSTLRRIPMRKYMMILICI